MAQVLPSGMVVLAEPNPDSLLAALEEAVRRVHTVDPVLQHQQVRHGSAAVSFCNTAVSHAGGVTVYMYSSCYCFAQVFF